MSKLKYIYKELIVRLLSSVNESSLIIFDSIDQLNEFNETKEGQPKPFEVLELNDETSKAVYQSGVYLVAVTEDLPKLACLINRMSQVFHVTPNEVQLIKDRFIVNPEDTVPTIKLEQEANFKIIPPKVLVDPELFAHKEKRNLYLFPSKEHVLAVNDLPKEVNDGFIYSFGHSSVGSIITTTEGILRYEEEFTLIMTIPFDYEDDSFSSLLDNDTVQHIVLIDEK